MLILFINLARFPVQISSAGFYALNIFINCQRLIIRDFNYSILHFALIPLPDALQSMNFYFEICL